MAREDDGRPPKYVGVAWYHIHVRVCASCWSYEWITFYCSVWITLRKLCRLHVAARFITVRRVHPRTGHEGLEGEMTYSSTLSLTLALNGVAGQRHDQAVLPLGKGPGTHCIEVWVGRRDDHDRCGKSRLHRDLISWASNPWRVAIPSTLSRPTIILRGWRKCQRLTFRRLTSTIVDVPQR